MEAEEKKVRKIDVNNTVGLFGVDTNTTYGKVIYQAAEMAARLVDGEHGDDINSVTVVVDFNVPEQAKNGLSPGVWIPRKRPDAAAPVTAAVRLAVMGHYLTHVSCRSVEQFQQEKMNVAKDQE